jgi:hypothetical protein
MTYAEKLKDVRWDKVRRAQIYRELALWQPIALKGMLFCHGEFKTGGGF